MKGYIALLILTTGLVLSACGQKGDLYHTEDTPPPEIEEPGK